MAAEQSPSGGHGRIVQTFRGRYFVVVQFVRNAHFASDALTLIDPLDSTQICLGWYCHGVGGVYTIVRHVPARPIALVFRRVCRVPT